MLPFVRKLGHPVPDFDFSIPGVTSISADLHKYGMQLKAHRSFCIAVAICETSVLCLHRLGGRYLRYATIRARAGGPIAAAWAILNYLGEEG